LFVDVLGRLCPRL